MDGKWVTALWFHRGEGAMEVESVGGTLTKMYGQESALAKGKVEYVTEYTTLRFKEPVAVEGEPELIGVWVKGNSNGGQLRFEIEDVSGVYR